MKNWVFQIPTFKTKNSWRVHIIGIGGTLLLVVGVDSRSDRCLQDTTEKNPRVFLKGSLLTLNLILTLYKITDINVGRHDQQAEWRRIMRIHYFAVMLQGVSIKIQQALKYLPQVIKHKDKDVLICHKGVHLSLMPIFVPLQFTWSSPTTIYSTGCTPLTRAKRPEVLVPRSPGCLARGHLQPPPSTTYVLGR